MFDCCARVEQWVDPVDRGSGRGCILYPLSHFRQMTIQALKYTSTGQPQYTRPSMTQIMFNCRSRTPSVSVSHPYLTTRASRGAEINVFS